MLNLYEHFQIGGVLLAVEVKTSNGKNDNLLNSRWNEDISRVFLNFLHHKLTW